MQVDEMVENIKDVVSRTLTASHWMDEKSRRIAIEKVDCYLINTVAQKLSPY